MKQSEIKKAAKVLQALDNGPRAKIISFIREGEKTRMAISRHIRMPEPLTDYHMGILLKAKIVNKWGRQTVDPKTRRKAIGRPTIYFKLREFDMMRIQKAIELLIA